MTRKAILRARKKRIEYGRTHALMRAAVKPYVVAGSMTCTRCHTRILAGQAWDLDHRDDRRGYLGVAHATCNRAAGARKRWDSGPGPSRDWLA